MSILTNILRRDQKALIREPGAKNLRRGHHPPRSSSCQMHPGLSYRFFSFPSAQAAEHFVDWDLRGKITLDTVCFWAMPYRPATDAEPAVLIRGAKAGSVHAFAFTNMIDATGFVRGEMGAVSPWIG
jgi:hypothetical protein